MDKDKQIELLKSCNIEDAPYFTLERDEPVIGLCCDVYDGDTVTLALVINEKVQKIKARLAGVDTAEIKTKNELEKAYGIVAKEYVKIKILNKLVNVHLYEKDKYGRQLTEIYEIDQETYEVDEESVNKKLINKGFAMAYEGGTKFKWIEYLEK